MPAIAEAAQQLAADGLPILLIDTCAFLDIIRAPVRKIRNCIQSALELAEMQAQSRCKLVASSLIQREWSTNEPAVMTLLDRHLEECDQNVFAIHDACELVKVPLDFTKPSYQASGLATILRDLAAGLLGSAIHLLPSNETTVRASDRTKFGTRPAKSGGGGHKDCLIIEEYLDLCRLLHAGGFAKKKVFCSSNTKDYQDGPDLHGDLARDFDSVGLVFTNALHWAVNELK